MIRAQDNSGTLHELHGWHAFETWASQSEAVVDLEVSVPESIEASRGHLHSLANSLQPGGTLRLVGLRPQKTSTPERYADAVATRTQEIMRDSAAAGMEFLSSRPACIQEHEFLHQYLGLTRDLIGRSRLQDTEFAEMTFRKVEADGKDSRLRLGIITQDLYYSFMYESPALGSRFNIMKMEYNPFSAPEYYTPLLDFKPDVLLVFRPDYLAPETYAAFDCPIIGFASEPLPRYESGNLVASDYNRKVYELLQKVRGLCDRLYHYDAACIEFLRREDFPVAGLFPPCICTDIYRPNANLAKRWDAVFIGKSTPHREDYLFSLHLMCSFFHGAHGLVGATEVLPFLQRAKIGLNIHRDETPNIEPRLPILMACGLFVLTEKLHPNPWFEEGVHCVSFESKAELVDKVRYYLTHDEERETIAANGRRWVCENASALAVIPQLIEEARR